MGHMSAGYGQFTGRDPKETSWKRGARQPPICGRLAAPNRRSLDNEGRFEGHGPGHVVEIGRSRHHRLVDLSELLLGAAALDADDVAQVLVPRRHGGIDSEEAAKIELAIGLDLQAFEGDPAHRTLRYVPHRHAGVERREQMFLRIGEPVCSTQFARFIDVDREPTRHPFSADPEAFDLRTAPGLSLPGRGDPPVCLAFCGVSPEPSISANRSSRLMPLTTLGSAIFVWATMIGLRYLGGGESSGWIIGGWRAPPGCAGPGLR